MWKCPQKDRPHDVLQLRDILGSLPHILRPPALFPGIPHQNRHDHGTYQERIQQHRTGQITRPLIQRNRLTQQQPPERQRHDDSRGSNNPSRLIQTDQNRGIIIVPLLAVFEYPRDEKHVIIQSQA
mmetsp:Transcript_54346/g.63518  ORF Transcript_54346/g.63518 Transcript_54346/m.63518 type:complete len:126 (-) Transcript_54346:208-585(-)